MAGIQTTFRLAIKDTFDGARRGLSVGYSADTNFVLLAVESLATRRIGVLPTGACSYQREGSGHRSDPALHAFGTLDKRLQL